MSIYDDWLLIFTLYVCALFAIIIGAIALVEWYNKKHGYTTRVRRFNRRRRDPRQK